MSNVGVMSYSTLQAIESLMFSAWKLPQSASSRGFHEFEKLSALFVVGDNSFDVEYERAYFLSNHIPYIFDASESGQVPFVFRSHHNGFRAE